VNLDFEQFVPVFPRDENPFRLLVVGDTVEHVGCGGDVRLLEQSAHVDHSGDGTCLRIDPDDGVRRIDVCPDFAFDPLHFVYVVDQTVVGANLKGSQTFESFGIEDIDVFATVAHIEVSAVGGQSPAFAVVVEFAQLLEGLQIIHEALVVLPSELIEFVVL